MKLRPILSTIILALAAGSAAASTIKLSLALDPAETLPGIPVTFRVEALNAGPEPAPVPRYFVLQVTRQNGESFLAPGGPSSAEPYVAKRYERDESPIIVPPAGSQRLDWWAASTSPPWYEASFWIEPGQYRLRLIADEMFPKLDLEENTLTVIEPSLIDPVFSNEVTLTIKVPTGVDAEVWKLICQNAQSHWLSAVADKVWDLYPDSEYTAYTVRSFGTDPEKMIEHYGAALRKNPRGVFGDDYRMAMVSGHAGRMQRFLDEDMQLAFQESEAARKLLEEILARDTSPGFKAHARERLEIEVMSMAEIEDYNRRVYGSGSSCERAQVAAIRNGLLSTITDATPDKARKTIADIVGHLDKYAAEASKTPPEMFAALGDLEQAVANLETALKNQLVAGEDGPRSLKALTAAAELSAKKAIEAADKDVAAKRSDVDLARTKFEEGRVASQAGDFKKAVARFREALHKAQTASKARGSFC